MDVITRYLMTDAGRDVFAAIERLELSFSQIKTLQLLGDSDAPVSLKAVSDKLGLSLPAISRAVDGLVKRGFVTRREDQQDRRSKLVALTPKGRRRIDELLAIRAAGLRRFVATLEVDERDALAAGLRPVAERPEIVALRQRRGAR
jgi:DNA-binding MarR family transcriptional regulator